MHAIYFDDEAQESAWNLVVKLDQYRAELRLTHRSDGMDVVLEGMGTGELADHLLYRDAETYEKAELENVHWDEIESIRVF